MELSECSLVQKKVSYQEGSSTETCRIKRSLSSLWYKIWWRSWGRHDQIKRYLQGRYRTGPSKILVWPEFSIPDGEIRERVRSRAMCVCFEATCQMIVNSWQALCWAIIEYRLCLRKNSLARERARENVKTAIANSGWGSCRSCPGEE